MTPFAFRGRVTWNIDRTVDSVCKEKEYSSFFLTMNSLEMDFLYKGLIMSSIVTLSFQNNHVDN